MLVGRVKYLPCKQNQSNLMLFLFQRCLKLLEVGACESLNDVVSKVLKKALNQPEGKEEELDCTLITWWRSHGYTAFSPSAVPRPCRRLSLPFYTWMSITALIVTINYRINIFCVHLINMYLFLSNYQYYNSSYNQFKYYIDNIIKFTSPGVHRMRENKYYYFN